MASFINIPKPHGSKVTSRREMKMILLLLLYVSSIRPNAALKPLSPPPPGRPGRVGAVDGLPQPIQNAAAAGLGFGLYFLGPDVAQASSLSNMFAATGGSVSSTVTKVVSGKQQSEGWELARQKRTAAIKALQRKNIVKVSTDDSGNQFLSLPWIPDRKIPYKQLTTKQRLQNEVCAGAFGEICKDFLLHPVDTAKTRRQARKKSQSFDGDGEDDNGSNSVPTTVQADDSSDSIDSPSTNIQNDSGNRLKLSESPFDSTSFIAQTLPEANILREAKSLYAAFPIVMLSSIPQGGIFFLVKKGLLEASNLYTPDLPGYLASILAIVIGVMAYWVFRTPAEVVKTQVQTGQCENIASSLQPFTGENIGNFGRLWKHYTVMLSLDAPFQIMNFLLYSSISDAVVQYGFEQNTLTRLFCGVTCGMICAAATCPIDVAKTRIISRDKEKESLRGSSEVTLIERASQEASTEIGAHAGAVEAGIDLTVSRSSNDVFSNTQPPQVYCSSSNYQRDSEIVQHMSRSGSTAGSSLTSTAGPGLKTGAALLDRTSTDAIDERAYDAIADSDMQEGEAQTGMDSAAEPMHEHELESHNNLGHGEKESQSVGPQITATNVVSEIISIVQDEGPGTLFLGVGQRLIYTGLANGIRLAAYGTSRMDLMMRSLDDL